MNEPLPQIIQRIHRAPTSAIHIFEAEGGAERGQTEVLWKRQIIWLLACPIEAISINILTGPKILE